ncbi:unnamed protein product [Symbiodinium sp. CCMP2592]|nr:unnamed protein product [Symbiodinium sp. CCMP2592]
MAPAQSKGGKGPQNSKMAKAMAAKSKAAKAKVKHEKQATPKRKAKAAKVELGDAGEEDDDSTAPSGLGYARGTISAALTGFAISSKPKKLRMKRKKTPKKYSKTACILHFRYFREYKAGDIATKREIEQGLTEGIDESGLEEDMKKDLLEELMSVLSKYFYVHSKGQVARQATETEESLGSHCSGMKNLQLKDKRIRLLQPSQSHTLAKDLLKKIVAEKRKLTQNNEQLKSLKTKISTKYSGDKTWDNHKAESVPADVTSNCTELVATFHTVVDQAANHDKGSKALLKKVNGLME